MGRAYYVPRSAKGESRILYIFTVKSFLTTLVLGGIGALIAFMLKDPLNLSIFNIIFIIIPFAGVGFGIGALTIPDIPLMGPLQKAGGENVLDILLRLASFRNKKKIYIYGLDRKLEKKPSKISNNPIKSVKRGS